MAAQMIPPPGAAAFLAIAGWGDTEVVPLAGDASFRRYFRVKGPGRRAVLMDAPPPHEDARPFLKMSGYLIAQGFAAPAVLAADVGQGLVLLEDFGDARMRETVETRAEAERGIYAEVVALLAELHRRPVADLPDYSREELQREAGLFVEWYCPAAGLTVDVQAYRAAWDLALDRMARVPPVTVLRDCHAENIMLIEGRDGLARLGLLDFQDALAGHPAYDLVSLLQDARRDVGPALEQDMLALYGTLARPEPDFATAYAVLGAQRNAKILGIFTRLWKRDGKARYLELLPRVWRYLDRDLAHPALVEVRAWFDANVPAAARAAWLPEA